MYLFRGVFQTLVDKHFPAPDRKKMAGLLGLVRDSDSNGSRSDVSSPVPKRKRKSKKELNSYYEKINMYMYTHNYKHCSSEYYTQCYMYFIRSMITRQCGDQWFCYHSNYFCVQWFRYLIGVTSLPYKSDFGYSLRPAVLL